VPHCSLKPLPLCFDRFNLIRIKFTVLKEPVWKPYSSRHEVETHGVYVGTGGSAMYVGGGVYNGRFAPAMLAMAQAGCYSNYDGQTVVLPAKNCVYLVNDRKYEWVPSGPSHSGRTDIGAVEYHGYLVGRAYHPYQEPIPFIPRTGKVLKNCCMYYGYLLGPGSEYSTTTFEVLVQKD
jgi:hypothetical protein